MINRGLILKYAIFVNFFIKGNPTFYFNNTTTISNLLMTNTFRTGRVSGSNFLKINEDFHKDITLQCHNQDSNNVTKWELPGIKKGKPVLINGDLFLKDLQKKDSGEYTCSTEEDKILFKYQLSVNSKFSV